MDSTEDDISARVLLRRVLHTELPKSPVTRSATNVRRSMRLKNTPGPESPGSALRHRLKKKLHESASLSPLPSPKRPRSALANTNPPVTAPSPVYDEDMTTRGLLRGIIQMETEASLLMSGQPALQESEPNQAESSAGERTEGLSGVELSDLTLNTEPLTQVVRGLSRKKPQRVFSVSAFEEQFDQLPDNTEDISRVFHKGDVSQEKGDASQVLDLSSDSKSGLNLTLKTPFVEKRIERAGLQRKVSNRRLQSVDAFDEAVQRCLEQGPNQDHSVFQDGKTLEDSSWQKFTLGLSDVTELYVQPKKDDTMGPSAENEREHELERPSEIPDSEPLIQEEKDHELESQDEEEVVHSSQDDVYLTPEDDIVLAPTQAMTESLPESHDMELQDGEFVEEVEIGNVVEIEYENVVETEDQEVVEIEHDSVEEVEDENVEDENVEEAEDENVEEAEDENVEEVEDENVEVENENVEEVEDENVEDENVEEVDDENVEDEKVEDENVEVENENVEDEKVEDENAEEVDDEKVEDENVEDEEVVEAEHNIDTSQYLVQITRRAHRSEGGGAVLGIPGTARVTKSFGAGLNPREKDLLDFVDEGRESLQDIPDEEREPLGSPEFPPPHPAAELSTPEQRSQQHEASVAEDDDAQEELNQSEEEELMDSEPPNHSPQFPQEEEEEEDDDDDALSAELSMKTPAFVRQKRVFTSRTTQSTPTVLKEVNTGPAPQVAKRGPRQKRQTGVNVLPKSYVMSVFKHFAKTKVASDVYPAINEILKKYFERLADDLEAYATHAKRKTIEVEDFELLMRRQGFLTDTTPVNILIEKYLPMEYRKLLIPVATSGNKVIPKQRR
ncbi:myb-like protein X isoform X2 [Onychostoma macrolepis]|uniref:myb-like protein X isoform X2 n=1 Tax=Onychostoma macrolepis TaxID=369639 RepID=UPI00272AAFB8|nr:myb-like protein X isoform X2 [Onychostoma macrolepis]